MTRKQATPPHTLMELESDWHCQDCDEINHDQICTECGKLNPDVDPDWLKNNSMSTK